MSFLYRENNKGPRTVSCRTPATTRAQSDLIPFTTTLCCKKHKKHLSIPMSFHLFNNYTVCFKKFVRRGVKSFFKVQNKSVNLTLIVHDFAQSFIAVFKCVLQLCHFLNACCLFDKRLCSSRWPMIFDQTLCSRCLQEIQVKETGR